jgi:hypothetical protein
MVKNNQKSLEIKGNVSCQSDAYEVLVNGADAMLFANGDFNMQVNLRVGKNQIVVKATDLEMNSSKDTFVVFRQEPVLGFGEPEILGAQDKYYALIIGVSDYPDPLIGDLNGYPTNDAIRLREILEVNYTFDNDDITLLLNPTKVEILTAFENLSRTITENDNLLIFFAGHGLYDQDADLGFWLPSDARIDSYIYNIYNNEVVDNLKRIDSKHTLLISDACFSGSIFRTRSLSFAAGAYQKKYDLRSRKAITSGAMNEAVNAKSVFFKYLADQLESNQTKYLSASELFRNLEFPVSNSSQSSPQYGTIQNVNDEGGDFIFVRK